MPKLEQMHTVDNRAGIGIDGHRVVMNADDLAESREAQEKANANRYFPPVSPKELPNQKFKKYKNSYNLQSETTWVLFELLGRKHSLLLA